MTEKVEKNNVTAAGLDQIREILIGQYAKETDTRQGRLEERIERDVAALAEALRKQITSTEEGLKRELAAHSQKLDEISKQLATLTREKVARRDLAAMFSDLAGRLGDDSAGR